jgi:hypothetical protein
MMLSRRSLIAGALATSFAGGVPHAMAAGRPTITVYKDPT